MSDSGDIEQDRQREIDAERKFWASSDEERETLIAEATERACGEPSSSADATMILDLVAALKAQRPVWAVQAEALEEAAAEMRAKLMHQLLGMPSDEWLLARAAELRRSAALIPPTSRTET